MRNPKDIQIGSRSLADVLADHALWLHDKGGGIADLSNTDLSSVDLRGAELDRAIIRTSNLCSSNLKEASLEGALLWETNLRGANLYKANLQKARMYGTNLWGANLHKANLREAKLWGAILRNTTLLNADLTGAEIWDCLGCNRYVRTVDTGRWVVCYTATTMSIGCMQLPIEKWWRLTDKRIDKMDRYALDWWRVWKPILKQIIDAAPAEPTVPEEDGA